LPRLLRRPRRSPGMGGRAGGQRQLPTPNSQFPIPNSQLTRNCLVWRTVMYEGAERPEKGTPRRHEDTESMRFVVSPRLRDGHFSVSCVPPRAPQFPAYTARLHRAGSLPSPNSQLPTPKESWNTEYLEGIRRSWSQRHLSGRALLDSDGC
jgi:hypothetical protein